jgi:hypothetical protein
MVYHSEILKIKKPSALTGEKQHRLSGVAVDLEFHISAQMAAVMLIVTNFHRSSPLYD